MTLLTAANHLTLFSANKPAKMRRAFRVTCGLAFALGGGILLAACQAFGPSSPPVRPTPTATPLPTTPTSPVVEDNLPRGQLSRVAVLLPLSGPQAPLGRAMLNAAQMALEDRGAPLPGEMPLSLLPQDTAGSGGAAVAAQRAIADGAQVILGPVFAADVRAVAPIAQAANIPVISFSTDRGVAGNGVYVMGLLPMTQVSRGLNYAATQGYRRVAVLAPATPYGQAVQQAVQETAASAGIAITTVRLFNPESRDPAADVKALQQGGSFDALLLADGGQRLRIFASLLEPFDIDPRRVKLLGTALWDDPSLGQDPVLADGWYAAPQPQTWLGFSGRYQTLFGAPPPRLSSLAYDGVSLVAVLARSTSGSFTAQDLTNPAGFAGIDGIFRFRPDGLVERGLAILRVTPEGPQVQDPAPQSFDNVQN